MGLFDIFKSSTEELTPPLAFACALLYMIAADGEIEPEEVGHLLTVLGGSRDGKGGIGVGQNNKELLDKALKYCRKSTPDAFIAAANPVLTEAQKYCILINLLDSLLSDGNADPAEQALFNKFLTGWGVSEESFEPAFKVIVTKNDKAVFSQKNHPKNSQKVNLAKR